MAVDRPAMRLRLPWPVPALLVWASAWGIFLGLQATVATGVVALSLASGWGVLLSALGTSRWRRLLIALGFPLSLALSGAAALPAWGWLLPLALCLLIYPLNAWRDAPLFPTPSGALRDLGAHAPLARDALVLDAGCGLGDGLIELHRAYPAARLHGIEWSWPLRALCALRCPWARVRRGDIWRANWGSYGMVYLFQRPESMDRAAEKALAELQPGAWLVSLEFEARTLQPQAMLHAPDGRPVWLYRAPLHDSRFGRITQPGR